MKELLKHLLDLLEITKDWTTVYISPLILKGSRNRKPKISKVVEVVEKNLGMYVRIIDGKTQIQLQIMWNKVEEMNVDQPTQTLQVFYHMTSNNRSFPKGFSKI